MLLSLAKVSKLGVTEFAPTQDSFHTVMFLTDFAPTESRLTEFAPTAK